MKKADAIRAAKDGDMETKNRLSSRGRLKGDDLVRWRRGLNLTQVEAASALQIPFNTYRQYERDKNSIPSVVEVAMWWVSCQKKQ